MHNGYLNFPRLIAQKECYLCRTEIWHPLQKASFLCNHWSKSPEIFTKYRWIVIFDMPNRIYFHIHFQKLLILKAPLSFFWGHMVLSTYLWINIITILNHTYFLQSSLYMGKITNDYRATHNYTFFFIQIELVGAYSF